MSFNFMSMNSIPLFFYEISISKRMNITSFLENNAANNVQNCTGHQKSVQKYQLKISVKKVQLIKREPVLDRSVDVNKR